MPPGRKETLRLFLDLISLIALPLIVFHAFLRTGAPLEAIVGDSLRVWCGNGTPVFDFLHSLRSGHGIATWSLSFSRPHFNLTSEFAPLFQTLLQTVTGSLPQSVKLDTFIHLILGSTGVYFLSRMLFRERMAAWFSAVLYAFIPFNVSTLQAEMGRAWGPMLVPFVYMALFALMSRPTLTRACVLALVLGPATLTHPENMFLTGFFVFFAAVLVMILRPSLGEGSACPDPKRAAGGLVIALLFFLGFWGFHLIFSVVHANPFTAVESVQNWLHLKAPPSAEAIRQSQAFFSALALEHWEWQMTPITANAAPPLGFIWYLPVLTFVVYGLYHRRDRWVWIWAILAILSVWFAVEMRARPSLFAWCHDVVPFFSQARHPGRFLYHFAMVIALFFGLSLSRWLAAGFKNQARMIRPAGCLVLAPFVLSGYLVGSHYSFTFIPVEEPAYVRTVRTWIEEHNTSGHRVLNGSGMPRLETLSFKTHFMADELLLRYHAKPYFADFLALLGFKYIVLGDRHQRYREMFGKKGFLPDRADDEPDTDDVMEYFSNLIERKAVTDRLLQNTDFIAHRPPGTRDVIIFENTKADFPYEVYPAQGIMAVGGPGAYAVLPYFEGESAGLLRPAPLFLAQQVNAARADTWAQASGTLLFHNTGPMDLWVAEKMRTLRFLGAYDVMGSGWDIGFQMTQLPQFNPALPRADHGYLNQLFGNLVYSRFAAVTRQSGRELHFSFTLPERRRHEILMRFFHAPGSGSIEISLDGTSRAIKSLDKRTGFWWISLGSFELDAGPHDIVLKTLENKWTAVDGILVESVEDVQKGLQDARNRFTFLRDLYLLTPDRFHAVSRDAHRSWVQLRRSGRYRIRMKGGGPFALEWGGVPVEFDQILDLKPGLHEIMLRGPIRELQSFLVEMDGAAPHAEWIKTFSYERQSSERLNIRGEAAHPFLVMQPETHFAGWKGIWRHQPESGSAGGQARHTSGGQARHTSGGQVTEPLIAHFFLNAYPVTEEGIFEGVIIYRNKTLFALSVISGLLFTGVLVWVLTRKRRVSKKE